MLKIPEDKLVAMDVESTGLKRWEKDQPFSFAFYGASGSTGFTQWKVDPVTRRVNINMRDYKILRKWWLDDSVTKVFWHANFDIRICCEGLGLPPIKGPVEDAQIAFHCLSSWENDYKLKRIADALGFLSKEDEKELHRRTIACRRKAKNLGWTLGPAVAADYWMSKQLDRSCNLNKKYNIGDVNRTMQLWLFCLAMFQKGGHFTDRYNNYRFEMDELWPCIYDTEERGMHLNIGVLQEEKEKCEIAMSEAIEELSRLAGLEEGKFAPGSDSQVRKLLFKDRGLKPKIFTKKTKEPSTSAEALENFQDDEAVQALTKYKRNEKGLSGFFIMQDEYKVWNDDKSCWLVHPNIKQMGKKTARLSVTEPNLQALTDTDGGRSGSDIPARKPFGPRPGYLWYSIDYSGLEIRTFAVVSQYQKLIDILNEGRDLHSESTEGVWGGRNNRLCLEAAQTAWKIHHGEYPTENILRKALDKVEWQIVPFEKSLGEQKTTRNKGKQFFFTRMFGGGHKSIMEKLKCTARQAKVYIANYDKFLPGVIQFVRDSEKQAIQDGRLVRTAYGRVLDLKRGEEWKASPWKVQGTAADLVKRAMIECNNFCKGRKEVKDGGVLLQIHDELIFEFPEDMDPKIVRMCCHIMEAQGQEIADYIDFPVEAKVIEKHWSEPIGLDKYKKGIRR